MMLAYGAAGKSIKEYGQISKPKQMKLTKIEQFVSTLVDPAMPADQQALVLGADLALLGGDNTQTCINHTAAACGSENRGCTNYGEACSEGSNYKCTNKIQQNNSASMPCQ